MEQKLVTNEKIMPPKEVLRIKGRRSLGHRTGFVVTAHLSTQLALKRSENKAYKAYLSRGGIGDKRPKLSEILRHTTVKKLIGDFANLEQNAGCALGAIAMEADALDAFGNVDWGKVVSHFAVSFDELNRRTLCPHHDCKRTDSVAGLIPHMNDIHEDSNNTIADMLEKHNL